MTFPLLVGLMACFIAVYGLSDVQLNNLLLTKGFKLSGAESGDQAGESVNFAGDVNNDGYPDVIVKAAAANSGVGVTYVIFGQDSSFNFADIDLGTMVSGPTTGFRILGAGGVNAGARSVGAAGDINNDGIDDFIVGLPVNDLVYVFYGNASSVVQDIEISNFVTSPEMGFKLTGDFAFTTGFCVNVAGDVNGDHILDVLVTARSALNNGGITYVVFGSSTRESDLSLESITQDGDGFRIVGAYANDAVGFSTSNAGDVNGDGIDDIILGAPFADIDLNTAGNTAGLTYVIFGRNTSIDGAAPWEDLMLIDFVSNATVGYKIIGSGHNVRFGWSVSGLGDINGDGYADVITSLWGSNVAFVVFGRGAGAVYEDINIAVWDTVYADLGFKLIGAAEAVSGAGDVNGDGYNDILCSTKHGSGLIRTVYVLFGHSMSTSFDNIILANMVTSDATGYRILPAVTTDRLGISLRNAGDFNNDGYDDVILSTVEANNKAGAVYIVFGEPSAPTSQPSTQPSSQPSTQPSAQPTQPTGQPTMQPSLQPYALPTAQPSLQPSSQPSGQPRNSPTSQPSVQPTQQPTKQPSSQPSRQPSAQPSAQPSTPPSTQPSRQPSTQPSKQPSAQPTRQPSNQPSRRPSGQPTCQPSAQPSLQPSVVPSRQPGAAPTGQPSCQPLTRPSGQPSEQPSRQPSAQPSHVPTLQPSVQPSGQPTAQPSSQPNACPSGQPSSQPSRQPSIQPSSQPSIQPVSCPSSQPSAQPSTQPTRQPSRQPTGQPTRAPSVTQVITSGEWVYDLNTNLTNADVTSNVDADVWICGGTPSISCVLVNAVSGLLSSTYSFPWDESVSVEAAGHANSIVVSANIVRSGVAYSEIATCTIGAVSLLCSVVEFTDTTFAVAISVPYKQQKVYVGQYNALPLINIVEPSTSGGSDTIRSYVYTPSAVRSVRLTQVTTVSNFAGVFLAGTGAIVDGGTTMPVIVAGWVSTNSGILSAMYLTHIINTIASDSNLVNAIAMVNGGPDSLIAGGLRLVNSAITNGYLVRINALYKTANFGFYFVSKTNFETQSVVKGMVAEGNFAYLLLNIAPPAAEDYFAVLKVNVASGAIVQQTSITVSGANVNCTEMVSTSLSLILTCTVQGDTHSMQSSIVVATNRDLSFKKLPAGWTRSSTISFMTLLAPFIVTSFTAPASSKVIPTSSFTYSTLGQSPTWRPTASPTIALSSQPTVRPSVQPSGHPSGQPSSSPTSAPSISPQPTSHPSTGGPTNTYKPTAKPTQRPSATPTIPPTMRPTTKPTVEPTLVPSLQPSVNPSVKPSAAPSISPTVLPTPRPTRVLTARPTRFTTPAPSIEGIGSDDAVPVPAGDAESNKTDMTGTVVIGLAAAGGALGFGLLVIVLCMMCSYKLRKSREKFVQERKAKLALQARNQAPTSQKHDIENVPHEALIQAPRSGAYANTLHEAPSCTNNPESISPNTNDVLGTSSSIVINSLQTSGKSVTENRLEAAHPPKSGRRLSEMEAQLINSTTDEPVHVSEMTQLNLGSNIEDDDSSVERGFNKIMAEFSDDSSWDSSSSGGGQR